MLLGLAIVTTGCQSNAFTREGLPVPVTKQGEVILSMWQGSWIAAWGRDPLGHHLPPQARRPPPAAGPL